MSGALPKFDIAFDPAAGLLRWAMRGLWSTSDAVAFTQAMTAAVEALGPRPSAYTGLADARDFPVQTGEVSAALGNPDHVNSTLLLGRVAIVVSSAMSKLQVQRTLKNDTIRAFLSIEDAKAWLQDKPAETA